MGGINSHRGLPPISSTGVANRWSTTLIVRNGMIVPYASSLCCHPNWGHDRIFVGSVGVTGKHACGALTWRGSLRQCVPLPVTEKSPRRADWCAATPSPRSSPASIARHHPDNGVASCRRPPPNGENLPEQSQYPTVRDPLVDEGEQVVMVHGPEEVHRQLPTSGRMLPRRAVAAVRGRP